MNVGVARSESLLRVVSARLGHHFRGLWAHRIRSVLFRFRDVSSVLSVVGVAVETRGQRWLFTRLLHLNLMLLQRKVRRNRRQAPVTQTQWLERLREYFLPTRHLLLDRLLDGQGLFLELLPLFHRHEGHDWVLGDLTFEFFLVDVYAELFRRLDGEAA